MRTTLPLAVAVAAILAYAVAESSLTTTMPLFKWSSDTAGPVGEPKSVDGALAQSLKTGSPEIVMVYMLSEVSSNQMFHEKESMANLKNVITHSKWSNFNALPLAKVEASSVLSAAREHGATAVEVKSSELQGFMAKHPELLTNSKPDVVVVNFPTKESLATVDSVVSATEKSIAPADSRVSILSTTSEMKDDVASSLMTFYSSSNLWTRPATIQQAQAGDAYLHPGGDATFTTRHSLLYGPSYYLTPTLLLAILVMIYIGVVALCAFCCILSLQTPEKFEGDMEKEMSSALNEEK
jgi:hypothetical protein